LTIVNLRRTYLRYKRNALSSVILYGAGQGENLKDKGGVAYEKVDFIENFSLFITVDSLFHIVDILCGSKL